MVRLNKTKFFCIAILFYTGFLTSCAPKDYIIFISTPYGKMDAILYDKTPEHKKIFLHQIRKDVFENYQFYKIIKDFMVVAGNPQPYQITSSTLIEKCPEESEALIEYDTSLFHKKGMLGAFKSNRSGKSTVGCEFYIVEGRKFSEEELNFIENNTNTKIPLYHRKIYKEIGGIPYLDQDYIIFGEIIRGLEIIPQLTKQETNDFGKPTNPIPITFKSKKVRKSKITKEYHFIYPTQ